MSKQETKIEPELEELRKRVQNGEKLFVQLNNDPIHSIKSDWYNRNSDERYHNKVLTITDCHYSVKEAIKIKLYKGKHGKYLHYKDLNLLTPEQVEEMTNTVFHFKPENL